MAARAATQLPRNSACPPWHADCFWSRMLSTETATWDEEPTLVHERLVVRMDAPIPPPLPACLSRAKHELGEDEHWLQTLPAAARAVLEQARKPQSLDAPRLRFAVAQPIG